MEETVAINTFIEEENRRLNNRFCQEAEEEWDAATLRAGFYPLWIIARVSCKWHEMVSRN